jgi:hypothetical protein
MKEERMKVLTDNEKYCQEEEEKRLKGEKSEEEGDDEGFVDEAASDDDNDDDNDEQAILNKIAKARKAGKIGDKDAADDGEDDYDEEEDSDYEYTGGDLAIYDSALDSVDELIFVKSALENLNG